MCAVHFGDHTAHMDLGTMYIWYDMVCWVGYAKCVCVCVAQGESRMLVFRLHALAGLMPEPVRQYCTNVYCMVYTQADTTDPITLLRGLYPTALPEELVGVAPELAGRQLSPEALKGALVYKVIQQAFTGQELRHRKWCEVSS